jgi:hypothetical protein
MADIKISQLTAKGTAIASTDLIEISESDGAGGYVTKSVTGANIIGSKQDTLISGTNIKTVNSTTLLGSGNLAVQPTLVSGTNIKTIEGQSILGGGNINITNTDVGLGNVDNTSDLNKPISTATQTALNAKQNTITNSDSITEGVTNLFLTTGERTKLTNTSGTNTGDQTNITGNAATVTTNANLTGVVTSTGNTTAIANGAISNAMLANGAVANLSGTNTGDQTNITGTADNVTGIVAVANGGTGTATPSLVAGTNVTITGTFPNQTINSTGGGGGGAGGIHVLTTPISNRVYGVRTNCPPGYTSGFIAANTIILNPFIPANTLTIKNLVLNITTTAVGGLIRAVIYSDLNGVPSSKLLESTDLIASTSGDKTYTVSFTFTAGTTYWLGAYSNANIQVVVVNTDRLIPISNNNLYGGYSTLTASVTYPNAPNTLGGTNLSSSPAVSINLTAL